MYREVWCLALFMLLLIGCHKEAARMNQILVRLDSQSPVTQEKLKVSDCKLDGNLLDDASPVHATPGEALELTGVLSPNEWTMGALMNGWNGDGESPRGLDLTCRRINVAILVHGEDTAKNLGVLEGQSIEARPVNKTAPSEFEFRVRFNAPTSRGKYAMDLRAADIDAIAKGRETELTKPVGIPLWRKEIWVD